MATAPTYGDQKVAPAPLPGEKLQAATPDLLSGIAQGVGGVGATMADEEAKQRARFENVAVMGATAELTNHSMNAEDALKGKRGQAAFEYSQQMLTDFDAKASSIGAKLTTQRARDLFEQERIRIRQDLDGSRKVYIRGELVQHAASVAAATRFTFAKRAEMTAGELTFDSKGQLDTHRLDQHLADLDSATDTQFKGQEGVTAAEIDAQKADDRAKTLGAAWDRVEAAGDPNLNAAFLQKYGGQMDAGKFREASQATVTAKKQSDSSDAASDILGRVSDPSFVPPPRSMVTFPLETGESEAPIDWKRPVIQNEDGTTSTERSITVAANEILPDDTSGQWVNIPTAVGGKIVSQEEAIAAIRDGREKPLGVYNTVERADVAAQARHEWWAAAENYDPSTTTDADRERGAEVLMGRLDKEKRNGASGIIDRHFQAKRTLDDQSQANDFETAFRLVRDQGWDVEKLKTERPSLINGLDEKWVSALDSYVGQRSKMVREQSQASVYAEALLALSGPDTSKANAAAITNFMPLLASGQITTTQYDDIVKYQKAYREGDLNTLQAIITPRDVATRYADWLYAGDYNPIKSASGSNVANKKDDKERETSEFFIDLQEAAQAEMTKRGVTQLPQGDWEDIAKKLATTKVVIDYDQSWRGGNDYTALVDVAGQFPADVRLEAAASLQAKGKDFDEAMLIDEATKVVKARKAQEDILRQHGLAP
jgi:hypothetical protein